MHPWQISLSHFTLKMLCFIFDKVINPLHWDLTTVHWSLCSANMWLQNQASTSSHCSQGITAVNLETSFLFVSKASLYQVKQPVSPGKVSLQGPGVLLGAYMYFDFFASFAKTEPSFSAWKKCTKLHPLVPAPAWAYDHQSHHGSASSPHCFQRQPIPHLITPLLPYCVWRAVVHG